jgi:WD40 repeat protein
MPPEVVEGRSPPGAAGDVYGLGALLYEMLTGRPPYDGPNVAETLSAVKKGDLALPRKLRHDLPADMEAVCLQCLHADPTRRYTSPQALADDLQRFLSGEPTLARPVSPIDLGLRWMRRNRTAVRVFAAVLSVVLAASTGLFIHARQLADAADKLGRLNLIAEGRLREAQEAQQQLQRQVYVQNVRLGYDAWRHFDAREFDARLDEAQPGPGDSDWRGFEWYYLRRLSGVAKTEWVSDSAALYHARFSPDGTRLACAGASGMVHVLDAGGAGILTSFRHSAEAGEGAVAEVNGVGFSPDGLQLATAGDDGMVRIWDWQQGQLIREIAGTGGKMYQAVFHPTLSLLAIGGEGDTARLVNSETGDVVRDLSGHTLAIEALEFSPDGSLVATVSSDGTSRVWRVDDGSLVNVMAPQAGRLSSLSFAPDGERVAVGSIGGSVMVWNVADNRCEFQAQHLDEVQGVAFSADGERIAACDRGGIIRLWDPAKAAESATIAMWTAHSGRAYCVQIAPNDQALVSVGKDRKLYSWVPGTPATRRLLDAGSQCPPINDFALIESNATLITAHEDCLRLWNAVTGEFLQDVAADQSGWSAVSVSGDGSLLAAQHSERGVCCWTLPSLQPAGGFTTAATPTVSELWLNDDGRMLAVLNRTAETELALFETATGRRMEFSAANCDAVAWMPGEAVLLDSHDDVIHLWDPERSRRITLWEGHESTINAFAISAAGDRVGSASSDRSVRVWDRKTGVCRTLSGHRSDVTAIAFSHDGRTIISGSENGRLIFWNDATGQLALELGPFAAGVERIELTGSDEQLLVLLSDGQLLILDAPRPQ